MKKGLTYAALTAMSVSAVAAIPAPQASASEIVVKDGVYKLDKNSQKYMTIQEFKGLTKDEKKSFVKNQNVVVVKGGKVISVSDLITATDAELPTKISTVADYEKANDVDFNKIVNSLNVESVSAINPTSVKVKFNKEVEALAKADVTVTNKNKNKVLVKSVKLAEDKKSATVEFYDALTAGDYKVAVKDAGEASFTFEVGVPTTIVADTAQNFDASKTGKVDYKVLDENGLDITSTVAKDITFETTDDNIVDENGNVKAQAGNAFVYVVYKSGNVELKSQRITVKTETAKVAEIVDYTVNTELIKGNVDFKATNYKQNTKVPAKGSAVYLHVQTKDQFGKVSTNASSTAKFESLDLDVAVVDATTGLITPIKEGKFAVKITDDTVSKTVELEVVAEAKATTIELDKTEVSVSNKANSSVKVKATVKNQFDTEMSGQTITAAATTNAGKDLVDVTVVGNEISVAPKAGVKSGTATIEVKVSNEVKATFTVTVTEAGVVDSYKLVGFESTLDKNAANTSETPVDATLSVVPVDKNGAEADAPVGNATYVVTDKDKKVVEGVTDDNKIEASELAVGTYSLTVKVGTVTVATKTFEVVNTTPKPELEFTATTVTDADYSGDVFEEVAAKLKATLAGKEYSTTAEDSSKLTVNKIVYTTTNSAIVKSASTNTIAFEKDGSVDLLIGEVTVTIGDEEYTIDMKNSKLTVKSDAEKYNSFDEAFGTQPTTGVNLNQAAPFDFDNDLTHFGLTTAIEVVDGKVTVKVSGAVNGATKVVLGQSAAYPTQAAAWGNLWVTADGKNQLAFAIYEKTAANTYNKYAKNFAVVELNENKDAVTALTPGTFSKSVELTSDKLGKFTLDTTGITLKVTPAE